MMKLDAFKRRLGSIKKAIEDKAPFEAAAKEWLEQDVLPTARAIVPVATGELRDSIGGTVFDDQVTIFADAPHAQFVEEGTSRMAAQPYLRPAIERTRRKLSERTRAHYRKEIK